MATKRNKLHKTQAISDLASDVQLDLEELESGAKSVWESLMRNAAKPREQLVAENKALGIALRSILGR